MSLRSPFVCGFVLCKIRLSDGKSSVSKKISEFTSVNVICGQAGSSLVERRKKRRFYMVSEFTSVNVGAVKLAQLEKVNAVAVALSCAG